MIPHFACNQKCVILSLVSYAIKNIISCVVLWKVFVNAQWIILVVPVWLSTEALTLELVAVEIHLLFNVFHLVFQQVCKIPTVNDYTTFDFDHVDRIGVESVGKNVSTYTWGLRRLWKNFKLIYEVQGSCNWTDMSPIFSIDDLKLVCAIWYNKNGSLGLEVFCVSYSPSSLDIIILRHPSSLYQFKPLFVFA